MAFARTRCTAGRLAKMRMRGDPATHPRSPPIPREPALEPVSQSGVFDPDVLHKLYPAHTAVLRQQRLTAFSRYQHTTLCVLTQDLSGLLRRKFHAILLRHLHRPE